MTTPLFLLRCVQLGLSIRDLDLLTIGMINDITRITSKVLGVNIRRFNLGAEDGIFDGFIDLYVHDIEELERYISRLRKIKGIDSVVKTDL